ncbi:MAG: DUF4157 domain-containing protein [Myxococcaceae bacterium]|nr:DUF4157 domain-containing protein [Myxococcaceae bacterium]
MSKSTTAPAQKEAAPAPTRLSRLTPTRGASLQRQCACGGGGCQPCAQRKRPLQRAERPGRERPEEIPSVVDEVLSSPGQPLDAGARSFMEPRLGQDFSQVRVHTDARAAESAQAVQALAYTVGKDIVFDRGQYQPDTEQGRHLLAHELAHTVQQQGQGASSAQALTFDSPGGNALEQEAEAVASAVMAAPEAGAAPPPAIRVHPRVATLSRTRNWKPLPSRLPTQLGQQAVTDSEEGPREQGSPAPKSVAFLVNVLYLPGAKLPFIKQYRAMAEGRGGQGGLQATLSLSDTATTLKQKRDGTKPLQNSWLESLNADAEVAKEAWQKISGHPFPQARAETCEMDHIVELQLGGANNPENITPLDKEANAESGSSIWNQLANLARTIGSAPQLFPHGPPEEITLQFKRVTTAPGSSPGTDSSATSPSCAEVAREVRDTVQGTASSAQRSEELTDYPIKAGGASTTLDALKAVPSETNLKVNRGRNRAANQLIPGLRLTLLRRKPGAGKDTLTAELDERTKTVLPITLREFKRNKGTDIGFNVQPPANTLQLQQKYRNDSLVFVYPHLSEGSFQLRQEDTGGVTGQGKLTPSEPLMNGKDIPVSLDLEKGEFHGEKSFPKGELARPFLGARITDSSLSIELGSPLQAQGGVDFEAGPQGKPWLKGSVTASASEENGFSMRGDLNAHLPGVDEARGTVEYADHRWKGEVNITSSQIALPYMKESSLQLVLEKKGKDTTVLGSGTVKVQPPGFELVELRLERTQKGWVYKGRGSLEVPGLGQVKFGLTHDGSALSGEGEFPLNRGGLSGKLAVHYDSKEGVRGSGTLSLEKKDLHASLKATLSKKGTLSGSGKLKYAFTPNMEGIASVELTENQLLKLKGGIQFPKPITLFSEKSNSYVLFSRRLDIPIVGLSVGPFSIGLIARISGGLGADYSIGPGTLKDISATAGAQINLTDLRKSSFDAVSLKGMLDIPAEAGLTLSVRGGIGLSAGVGSITGGITAIGGARLIGGLTAAAQLQYTQGHFIVDLTPSIKAGLVLSLGLSADVTAEAFGREKKWEWNLAKFAWDSGLVFGLSAPIHYDSAKAFKPPAPSEIQWIVPDIDVRQLVSSLVKRARG